MYCISGHLLLLLSALNWSCVLEQERALFATDLLAENADICKLLQCGVIDIVWDNFDAMITGRGLHVQDFLITARTLQVGLE